jgi:[ribosomal protein S18]-alanine N-acetyltransferase
MSALARPSEGRFVPLLAHDLDRVAAIERELYAFPWTRGNFQDSLQAGYSTWTLRDGYEELVAYGVVMIAIDEAHLLNLSVARAHQRQGYGWRMLDWMASRSRDHGARTMLLEVRPSNVNGRRLYSRYGFERIGGRRDYYPAIGGREDADVMRIAL